MSKLVKCLVVVLFGFHVGRSNATLNFFEGQLYIPLFDYPYACKTAAGGNCEYHPPTGACMPKKECEEMSFREDDCRRANSFYSIGGVLCHNRDKIQVNCENTTTILAVNFAGDGHKDKRNICYVADNSTFYEDEYNTRRESNENIDLIEDDDRNLYGNYAVGKENGMDKGQCLFYSANVDQDGEYELAFRTIEPLYSNVGKRIFSLVLNQVPIVLHVDLRSLSVDLTPVDIIANFKIERDSGANTSFLTVKGHPQIIFTGVIQVGLCVSDCRLCREYSSFDPSYVGSGLSLVRLTSMTEPVL